MPFPIGSIINQVPHAPYDGQREALLYEILQALGGNPDEIMSKPWTAGNEGNFRPPYTSLTDALLYEIWMVINSESGSGGSETSIIYYGLIKDGTVIDPEAGIGSKIVKSSSNYYIVPPAIANLAGHTSDDVRLWIAEPVTEPVKTATLWLRNLASTFINDQIGLGALMASETIGSYRVYVSEPMDAQLFNGQYIGPVFCSQHRTVSIAWGTPPPEGGGYYGYLGPLSGTEFSLEACSTWENNRTFYSLRSSIAAIEVGDQIYDSPGIPYTTILGAAQYYVFKATVDGPGYIFRLGLDGIVTETPGICG